MRLTKDMLKLNVKKKKSKGSCYIWMNGIMCNYVDCNSYSLNTQGMFLYNFLSVTLLHWNNTAAPYHRFIVTTPEGQNVHI